MRLASGQTLGARYEKKLFLAIGADSQEWCIYTDEARWKSDIASLGSSSVGTLDYSGDRLSAIDVTQEDETGDWIVYDHYSVSPDNRPTQDSRRINILPGDRTVNETYAIENGHAERRSSLTRSLSTGQAPSNSEKWLPDVPVFVDLHDFPFVSLIPHKYSENLSDGKRCAVKRP
jgi:hypothetical protein